ncbi:phosphoadenosine phosphosulfate reductase (plasmid) [Mycobacterium paragordonae]|nr:MULTISPECIES: phosphoadenosine phosphosulfate reductase family protein [Mycobacterium]AYE99640.1 phosphoadenosine phosphosulfate reductase [Mycobacterium paragordonae]QNI09785.1 phosphoadenosine phosphosulfate reductase family protein [Mycobacterium kubicae]
MLREVRARRRGPHEHRHLLARIENHLEQHDGFVAWSGGKDSTVVMHLARQIDPNIPVVFYDSGLQFSENLRYIENLAASYRLNLQVIPAEPDLLTILIAVGGFDHRAPDRELGTSLAEILISAPAAVAHSRYGPGSLWGVRAAEAVARTRLYRANLAALSAEHPDRSRAQARAQLGGIVRRADGTTTYGPIWDWRRNHVFEYLAGVGLPPNPLYSRLAQLGAPAERIRVDSIIDAAKLSNGHIAWLQKGWPDLFDRLSQALPRLPEWT